MEARETTKDKAHFQGFWKRCFNPDHQGFDVLFILKRILNLPDNAEVNRLDCFGIFNDSENSNRDFSDSQIIDSKSNSDDQSLPYQIIKEFISKKIFNKSLSDQAGWLKEKCSQKTLDAIQNLVEETTGIYGEKIKFTSAWFLFFNKNSDIDSVTFFFNKILQMQKKTFLNYVPVGDIVTFLQKEAKQKKEKKRDVSLADIYCQIWQRLTGEQIKTLFILMIASGLLFADGEFERFLYLDIGIFKLSQKLRMSSEIVEKAKLVLSLLSEIYPKLFNGSNKASDEISGKFFKDVERLLIILDQLHYSVPGLHTGNLILALGDRKSNFINGILKSVCILVRDDIANQYSYSPITVPDVIKNFRKILYDKFFIEQKKSNKIYFLKNLNKDEKFTSIQPNINDVLVSLDNIIKGSFGLTSPESIKNITHTIKTFSSLLKQIAKFSKGFNKEIQKEIQSLPSLALPSYPKFNMGEFFPYMVQLICILRDYIIANFFKDNLSKIQEESEKSEFNSWENLLNEWKLLFNAFLDLFNRSIGSDRRILTALYNKAERKNKEEQLSNLDRCLSLAKDDTKLTIASELLHLCSFPKEAQAWIESQLCPIRMLELLAHFRIDKVNEELVVFNTTYQLDLSVAEERSKIRKQNLLRQDDLLSPVMAILEYSNWLKKFSERLEGAGKKARETIESALPPIIDLSNVFCNVVRQNFLPLRQASDQYLQDRNYLEENNPEKGKIEATFSSFISLIQSLYQCFKTLNSNELYLQCQTMLRYSEISIIDNFYRGLVESSSISDAHRLLTFIQSEWRDLQRLGKTKLMEALQEETQKTVHNISFILAEVNQIHLAQLNAINLFMLLFYMSYIEKFPESLDCGSALKFFEKLAREKGDQGSEGIQKLTQHLAQVEANYGNQVAGKKRDVTPLLKEKSKIICQSILEILTPFFLQKLKDFDPYSIYKLLFLEKTYPEPEILQEPIKYRVAKQRQETLFSLVKEIGKNKGNDEKISVILRDLDRGSLVIDDANQFWRSVINDYCLTLDNKKLNRLAVFLNNLLNFLRNDQAKYTGNKFGAKKDSVSCVVIYSQITEGFHKIIAEKFVHFNRQPADGELKKFINLLNHLLDKINLENKILLFNGVMRELSKNKQDKNHELQCELYCQLNDNHKKLAHHPNALPIRYGENANLSQVNLLASAEILFQLNPVRSISALRDYKRSISIRDQKEFLLILLSAKTPRRDFIDALLVSYFLDMPFSFDSSLINKHGLDNLKKIFFSLLMLPPNLDRNNFGYYVTSKKQELDNYFNQLFKQKIFFNTVISFLERNKDDNFNMDPYDWIRIINFVALSGNKIGLFIILQVLYRKKSQENAPIWEKILSQVSIEAIAAIGFALKEDGTSPNGEDISPIGGFVWQYKKDYPRDLTMNWATSAVLLTELKDEVVAAKLIAALWQSRDIFLEQMGFLIRAGILYCNYGNDFYQKLCSIVERLRESKSIREELDKAWCNAISNFEEMLFNSAKVDEELNRLKISNESEFREEFYYQLSRQLIQTESKLIDENCSASNYFLNKIFADSDPDIIASRLKEYLNRIRIINPYFNFTNFTIAFLKNANFYQILLTIVTIIKSADNFFERNSVDFYRVVISSILKKFFENGKLIDNDKLSDSPGLKLLNQLFCILPFEPEMAQNQDGIETAGHGPGRLLKSSVIAETLKSDHYIDLFFTLVINQPINVLQSYCEILVPESYALDAILSFCERILANLTQEAFVKDVDTIQISEAAIAIFKCLDRCLVERLEFPHESKLKAPNLDFLWVESLAEICVKHLIIRLRDKNRLNLDEKSGADSPVSPEDKLLLFLINEISDAGAGVFSKFPRYKFVFWDHVFGYILKNPEKSLQLFQILIEYSAHTEMPNDQAQPQESVRNLSIFLKKFDLLFSSSELTLPNNIARTHQWFFKLNSRNPRVTIDPLLVHLKTNLISLGMEHIIYSCKELIRLENLNVNADVSNVLFEEIANLFRLLTFEDKKAGCLFCSFRKEIVIKLLNEPSHLELFLEILKANFYMRKEGFTDVFDEANIKSTLTAWINRSELDFESAKNLLKSIFKYFTQPTTFKIFEKTTFMLSFVEFMSMENNKKFSADPDLRQLCEAASASLPFFDETGRGSLVYPKH